MTRLSAIVGRRVVAQSSGQELGTVRRLLIERGTVTAAEVRSERGSSVVDWTAISAVGPDALIVGAPDVFRPPANEREQQLVAGELDPRGKPVFSDGGNHLGRLDDIEFDDAGRVTLVAVPGHELPAAGSLIVGHDVVVVAA